MTLWGGRFEGSPDERTWEYTVDRSDGRMIAEDIEASIAHASMLGATGIIPPDDAGEIVRGLRLIRDEVTNGSFEYRESDEDIHTAVERRLFDLIGPVAGKLHTGRSRNDQVATDLRLYLQALIYDLIEGTGTLVRAIVAMARESRATVIPTYTHLQQAQSTTLGEHLLAHAWALSRDMRRFRDLVARFDESPLGAGASAGSTLPLDREMTAHELGFAGAVPNTLDAVGSRDMVAEFVFCCGQEMVHLSRLAEEIILWSTREFGWVTLSDGVSTGSSALPHKRNPDIAELVRGRTARAIGGVTAILTLQKAMPLTYNRDFQEDKRIAFESSDTLYGSVMAMVTLLGGITFDPPAPSVEVATLDLADALVERGVPFREAHNLVGRVVKTMEEQNRVLESLTDDDLSGLDPRFQPGDSNLIDPARSVARRDVPGQVDREADELERIVDGLVGPD